MILEGDIHSPWRLCTNLCTQIFIIFTFSCDSFVFMLWFHTWKKRFFFFFFFWGGGELVLGGSPPPPPRIRRPFPPFFFSLLACQRPGLVMYDGYPYSVSGKLTQNFEDGKNVLESSPPPPPTLLSDFFRPGVASIMACNVNPPPFEKNPANATVKNTIWNATY